MKNKQEYEEELEMGKGGFTLPGESGYEELTLIYIFKYRFSFIYIYG